MDAVSGYMRCFREGDRDTAFFGLLEKGIVAIPELTATFHNETEPSVREFIVEVIGQYRDPSALPFLSTALRDSDPNVWKQALDGLVTIGCLDAIECLRSVRDMPRANSREAAVFQEWIDEAIEQIEAVANGANCL